MKSRIKVPPQHKLRRAMRRASRHTDCGAFCAWCGRGYSPSSDLVGSPPPVSSECAGEENSLLSEPWSVPLGSDL